ncbi:MAG: hypothetical protein ACOX4G_06870 [Limnochordia bacterium]|jgi:hypothetical protein
MHWERELEKLLAAYEAVQRELDRKAVESENPYFEGSRDAYAYITEGLRSLIGHAARLAPPADTNAAA